MSRLAGVCLLLATLAPAAASHEISELRREIAEERLERERLQAELGELAGIVQDLLATVGTLKVKREDEKRLASQAALGALRLSMARDTSRVRLEEDGWVTIQARGQYNNPVDYFARDAAAYEVGFGDPAGEFWLGLDRLELLTRPGPVQLRVELETWQGHTVTAHYKSFQVVGPDYRLHVAAYSGDAGDALRIDNGMAFSTLDKDKDDWPDNCSAARGGGGWWFNACSLANLNGRNLGSGQEGYEGILWYSYKQDNRSFRSTRMMIRKQSL